MKPTVSTKKSSRPWDPWTSDDEFDVDSTDPPESNDWQGESYAGYVEVQIPSDQLSKVTGKDQERIELNYNVKLSAQPDTESAAATRIFIWGMNPESCLAASQDITDHIPGFIDRPRPSSLIPLDPPQSTTLALKIPNEHLGRVLGKKRHNLNRIEQEYHVKVQHFTEDAHSNEFKLIILGFDRQNCMDAIVDILDRLPITLMIHVEPDNFRKIIGHGALRIRQLRIRHGFVDIRVLRENSDQAGYLEIQGPARRCRAVRREVMAIMDAADFRRAQSMNRRV